MASYSLHSTTTVKLWLTKTELADLKSSQLAVSDFINGSMKKNEATKLIKSSMAILTSVFKIPVVEDLLNELASYTADAAKDEKDDLYDGAIAAWGTMDSLLSKWNSKIGLFKENIVKVEIAFPAVVYKNRSTGKLIQIFNKAGYQTGAIDANGVKYLS